jgi:tetratricopeptide (TPR) repeat protein
MRKSFLAALAVLLFTGLAFAQETPDKAAKKAGRSLSTYFLDPANNGEKLEEAKELIDIAITGEEQKMDAGLWIDRGEIYNAVAGADINKSLLDPAHQLSEATPENAFTAQASFMKAIELAEKKWQTRDALTGLKETSNYFNILGSKYINTQDFAGAYPYMDAVVTCNQVFNENGGDPVFEKEEDWYNHLFLTGFCASLAGKDDVAKEYLGDLAAKDYKEPLVYSTYFGLLTKDGNEEEAIAVMDKAKKLFPGNTDLLFAEINYFLQQGRMDELVGKLEMALEKEPDNVSLYSTMGSVYDNLFQRELEAGNKEKAQENFDKAKGYFSQALEKKPDYGDAIYSLGALYYNKAAALTKELKELEGDYSKAGIAAFNAKQDEVNSYFDQALPYFKDAEKLNPNDTNTLIALKEIYAKKGEIQISNEFKTRLENVQNNIDNESYFKGKE